MTIQEVWDKYQNRLLAIILKLSEDLRAHDIRVGEPFLGHEVLDVPILGWAVDADSVDIPPDLFSRVEAQVKPVYSGRVEFRIVANVFRKEGIAAEAVKFLGARYGGPSVEPQPSDTAGLEEHVQTLEAEYTWKPIGAAVIGFVEDLRRKFRKKPREWSPRWDKPSMGAPGGIAPIRINIVEEEGWKWKDSEVSNWASDNAWDDIVNMSQATRRELIRDLIEASMTKKEQKAITDEDMDKILEQFDEDPMSLEETKNAIQDAHYWAWEVAYMPEDGDIEHAMREDEHFWGENIYPNEYWELVLKDEGEIPAGPREWSPRRDWTMTGFWKDLAATVRYERKPNSYDRYLVFDWGQPEPVKQLLKVLKEHPEEGSRRDVESEIREWAQVFTDEMLDHLDRRMQNVDTSYRVDFDPMWKRMLSDKSTMANVRKELLEFLEMGPRDWSPRRGKK